jgi:hypothetical protein
MERARLILTGTVISLTILALWHRKRIADERQRAVSDERRHGIQSTQQAA